MVVSVVMDMSACSSPVAVLENIAASLGRPKREISFETSVMSCWLGVEDRLFRLPVAMAKMSPKVEGWEGTWTRR